MHHKTNEILGIKREKKNRKRNENVVNIEINWNVCWLFNKKKKISKDNKKNKHAAKRETVKRFMKMFKLLLD